MINDVLNRQWSVTAAGTNAGATATQAAVAGVQWVITHVSGHTDADATLQLRDGSTVLAEWKIDVSVEGFQFRIAQGVWVGSTNTAVAAVISASSADCQVNIAGYGVP
jgi:hypothetical protein